VTTEATASSGAHLSIGEVLDQLRSEFPDVTISKIRFLESQGLIDPERTPSGYRRFYPPDLQRLRWILVQQRDHFLPLRVIKERLDAFGPTGAPRIGSTNGGGNAPPGPARTPAPTMTSPPTRSPTAPTLSPTSPPPGGPRPSAPASSTPPAPSASPSPASAPSTLPPSSSPPSPPTPAARPTPPPARPPRPQPPTRPPAREPLVELDDHIDTEDDEDHVGVIRGGRDVAASTDLTRGELIETTGLSHAQLDALESFGIIAPLASDDGEVRYDDEMLAVAELAAGCYRRGIEARHLKMYWHFAEREAALFAQVLLPYVKQRNPASRAKLQGELEELARLGRRLRTAMLRRALRSSLAE
jgi:DNA-binding transcriptional MerR regulator